MSDRMMNIREQRQAAQLSKEEKQQQKYEHFVRNTVTFDDLVQSELRQARVEFPRKMSSLHEGFAILKEEVDELWDVVKSKNGTRQHLLEELVQIAAMAQRMAEDVLRDS